MYLRRRTSERCAFQRVAWPAQEVLAGAGSPGRNCRGCPGGGCHDFLVPAPPRSRAQARLRLSKHRLHDFACQDPAGPAGAARRMARKSRRVMVAGRVKRGQRLLVEIAVFYQGKWPCSPCSPAGSDRRAAGACSSRLAVEDLKQGHRAFQRAATTMRSPFAASIGIQARLRLSRVLESCHLAGLIRGQRSAGSLARR